ncbi:MAG TPA: hypothetical protein PLI19_01685 [Erysipelotrichaceae bacterium]|nr:hypothetical protein [Erysipelotrichaceae bacterium]
MRISNINQLNQIKEKFFSEVHMREVGEMRDSEIINIYVLAVKELNYEAISEFIRKVYGYFEEMKMDKVKVIYKGDENAEAGFDLKISNFGEEFVISKTNVDEVTNELRKIFG